MDRGLHSITKSIEMASKDTKTKAANAFKAMKALGIAQDKVKPVLKNLLKLYDRNWTLIEEENYRVLADAIFERDESEASQQSKKHTDIQVAEDFFDGETLVDQELERPLKRLHCTDLDGPNSSYGATCMLETPLIKPNEEKNVMHELSLVVYQNVVEPRETNGEIYTRQCSSQGKGKQVVSPRTSTPMENHGAFHPSELSREQCFPSRMDPRLPSHTLMQREKGSKSTPSPTEHGNSSLVVCHKEPKIEPMTSLSPKEKSDVCVVLDNPNMDHHQHCCDSTKMTLLHRQNQHISKKILSGEPSTVIQFKHGDYYLSKLGQLDDRVVAYLINWGFYGVLKTIRIKLDPHLLTAMMERWRPETHTFFLPVGEATVTLQDVSIIWGLPVHGKTITGTPTTRTRNQLVEFCTDTFGWTPKHEDIKNPYFQIRPLGEYLLERSNKTFESDLDVIRFARAVALMIVVSVLLPDTNGNSAKLILLDLFASSEVVTTFSWGSAVLANLYRELCKGSTGGVTLGGAFRLVQIWAWTRIPSFTPILKSRFSEDAYDHRCYPFFGWRRFVGRLKHTNTAHNNLRVCRDALDAIWRREFVWTPYDAADLERVDSETIAAWKYKGPLIFFGRVEPHHPDRVSRQFGLPLNIPRPPESADVLKDLHSYNAEKGQDWNTIHAQWIRMWDHLHDHIWDESAMVSEETYYAWYMTHEVMHLAVRSDKKFGWRGGTVKSMARVATKINEFASSHLQGQSEASQRLRDLGDSMFFQVYGCRPSPHNKSSRKDFHPPPEQAFHKTPEHPPKPKGSSNPPRDMSVYPYYCPYPPPYVAPEHMRSSYPPPVYPYFYPCPPPNVAPGHTPHEPPCTSRAHHKPQKSSCVESGDNGDDSGDT